WHNLPERMLQDGVEPWHTGTSGILRGAKTTTYEGGSRVPGIFHWPGVIPAGQVSREMATAIDIFPTLLRVCEAKLPREVALDGHDLLAHLKGESASPRTDFFYSKGKKFEAIRQGAWKLRHTEAAGMELFHLDRDPAEMYNLAEREPEKVQELWQALQEKAAEVGAETYPAEMAETD
ncbi:MAG: sulfatase/phosphatase domain-containing protein, partial [Bacteroidota bacterium]